MDRCKNGFIDVNSSSELFSYFGYPSISVLLISFQMFTKISMPGKTIKIFQ